MMEQQLSREELLALAEETRRIAEDIVKTLSADQKPVDGIHGPGCKCKIGDRRSLDRIDAVRSGEILQMAKASLLGAIESIDDGEAGLNMLMARLEIARVATKVYDRQLESEQWNRKDPKVHKDFDPRYPGVIFLKDVMGGGGATVPTEDDLNGKHPQPTGEEYSEPGKARKETADEYLARMLALKEAGREDDPEIS